MMKKKLSALLALLVAVMCICLTGCGTTVAPENILVSVFPVSTYNDTERITMGDVMPFYDNGVMNIYHLQNSRGSQSVFFHPIARLTTTDYVSYEDKGIVIPFEENVKSPDAALGTGSFIKDEQGVYHCFYTGHSEGKKEDTGLEFKEVVRHATSTDQIKWTKIEDFNIYGNSDDFRDPYVYYDRYDECYYMLVTTNEGGKGIIKRYSANSLDATSDEWVDRGVFFSNDEGTYNMECPSYIEYNGYWYLAYSEQGDNRVTHYRYRTERNGEWKKFERDSIDASGFYAGRLEKAEDELYAFAWCATLKGGAVGDFDWGGNLVAHKIVQKSNGELCAVPIESIQNAISTPVTYCFADGTKAENISFSGKKFQSLALTELPEGTTRVKFNIKIDNYDGDFGMTFGLKDVLNNRLGDAIIAFEPSNSKLKCYNDVSSIVRYGNPLAEVDFAYQTGRSYAVELLIEDEVITVYLDNTVAMTSRIVNMAERGFAFYSNGINVEFGGLQFYE